MDVDTPVASLPPTHPAAASPAQQDTESGHVPHGRRTPRIKGPKLVRKPGINPNTHGHIPGVPVLFTFVSRYECCEMGVHAHNWRGIHGQKDGPAFSVVLSGGYEDDEDKGDTFIYTGEGGRSNKTSKGKKTQPAGGPQVRDQEWIGGNKSLQLSHISGQPVRVVRGGHKFRSRYAPPDNGYRYDGLYKVTSATRARGKSGFYTCQFTFERMPGQPLIPILHRPLPKVVKKARPTPRRDLAARSAQVKEEPLSDDEDQLATDSPTSDARLLGKRKREDEEEDIKPLKHSKEEDEKFLDSR